MEAITGTIGYGVVARLFRGGAGTHHEYKTRGPDTGCL